MLEQNYALWRAASGGSVAAAVQAPVMRTVFVAADETEVGAVRASLEREARALAAHAPASLARAAAAPLGERALVGTAGEVRDGIARYRERLGMDLLVARIEVPGVPPAARDASLERVAESVLAL
jgi:alkanesulfonate monooxygenase SsuD/methylene tetrahydromethanopterin reductase-like flavin-dependent oxidoreductase (luciferase family)